MAQNNPYSYALWGDAINALALRLNDPNMVHWSSDELVFYVQESLRVWNCLTQTWAQDFTASYSDVDMVWQSTGNAQNPSTVGTNPTSPRFQTLTDTTCYTVAQYHLLEPPSGGTWTGSSQFNISDFSQALQRRRDDVLQIAAANVAPLPLMSLPPGQNRIYLPDAPNQSILDVRRVRFIPDPAVGQPSTLYRDDELAMEYFETSFPQLQQTPTVWDVLAGPPLALTFDASWPNVGNHLDVLAILSGGIINPPVGSPLLIPDDFYWILKFGMMADVLRKESESTDLARAAYCEQRFAEGLRVLMEFPWLLQARINNVTVDTPSIIEADVYDYEWQSNVNAQPNIIVGGLDLFALAPIPQTANPVSVTLTMIGNAPVTTDLTQPIQVSRDVLDRILDEAQHLAQFKLGGSEFTNSLTLHENFIRAAVKTNQRLALSGIFASTLRLKNSKQDAIDPRFAVAAQGE